MLMLTEPPPVPDCSGFKAPPEGQWLEASRLGAMAGPRASCAEWPNSDGLDAVRRLLDVARSSGRARTRDLVDRPSDTRLVVALDVDVSNREGTPWVQYDIVLCLHRRASAYARVVLYDERAKELLRVFEQGLTSSAIARVRGGFPLSGECALWCGAVLLDDGDARGESFAWIGPRRDQPRGGVVPRTAPMTVSDAAHARHGPGLRIEAKLDGTRRTPGRSE